MNGRIQVKIDPGRRNSLVEAGILAPDGTVQNPQRFARMLKQYADYDRVNGAAR